MKKISYAQRFLQDLINQRKLRKWCLDNNLPHANIYHAAMGETPPTYKRICSLSYLIPPIDWLFATDEKRPYTPQVVPIWDYKAISKFHNTYKNSWKELAIKCNIDKDFLYGVVKQIYYPSLNLMRSYCTVSNPLDFFVAPDTNIITQEKYVPKRCDIVNDTNDIILVLSNKEHNEKYNLFVGCLMTTVQKEDTLVFNLKETLIKSHYF